MCQSFIAEKVGLCTQADLEEEVAVKAAVICSLEANVQSLTISVQETSEELQILQGSYDYLEDFHKATTARLETQLAAKVRNGSHCRVLSWQLPKLMWCLSDHRQSGL